MKKLTSGKEVYFQKDQMTEDKQEDRTTNIPSSGVFSYRKVPAMKPVVEVKILLTISWLTNIMYTNIYWRLSDTC
jgi:hypothetical protein